MLESDWRRRLLSSIGAPVTKQNLNFLTNWQRQEGGGTANSANFNPLNTTTGKGSSINSVGVKSFQSASQGTRATAATLENGRYNALLSGLRSGDPGRSPGVSGDLETWVSGSRSGNPSYASKVLGQVIRGNGGGGLSPLPNYVPNPAKIASTKNQLINQLMQSAQQFATGNVAGGTQALAGAADARHAYLAAYQQLGPIVSPKGTLSSPGLTGNAATDTLLKAVHSQIGQPYVFGSEKPGVSFDCSGLVQWAYSKLGVKIPRTTYDQFKTGRAVQWGNFQPGDLIFVAGSDGTRTNPGHVVMYVGGGKVVAAPHTGTVVQYQPVSQFKNDFAGARRII